MARRRLHISDDLCLLSGREALKGEIDDELLVVFDVGANEGLFASRISSEWLDLHFELYCFEPNPIAYQKLIDTAEGLESVTTIERGLSDQKKTATLYHPEKKTVLGSFINRGVFEGQKQQWGEVSEQTVTVTTIDQYLLETGLQHIHYLKIDTEGTELNVLMGAKNALANRQITCGQFEYGGTFLDAQLSVTDVFDFLGKYEYMIYDLEAKTQVDSSYADDFLLKNLFFCHKALASSLFSFS